MKDYNVEYCQEILTMYAEKFSVCEIAKRVIFDKQFIEQSGCHCELGHHYGKHGLLYHTTDVCVSCMENGFSYSSSYKLNLEELFLSALFHDYGKIWDYEYCEDKDEFVSTEHKRIIHHISRSAIEWNIIARAHDYDSSATERVTHNILAHHGQREYGSPVAPKSREAWILHCCDQMSARVDDCDRLDLITIKQ